MTNVNKTLAFSTLNKFADSRAALIKGMHDAGYTLETARGVVIEWACGKVGSHDKGFNVKESGKVTLASGHKKYEAAKTVVRDVMLMLAGTTRRKSSASREHDPVEHAIKVMAGLTPAQRKKVLAAL